MSGSKKYFGRWKDDLRKSAVSLQTFGSLGIFELVNKCLGLHLDGLLNDRAAEQRLELFEGLEELEEAIFDRDTEAMRDGFNDLQGDSEKQRLMRTHMNKLLGCKSGQVLLVFNTWRNLPEPKDRALAARMNKFERGLANFYRSKLLESWRPFRDEDEAAQSSKRVAGNRIAIMTMSGT
jgi:hypothetical protein